jgi:hypothetical protein
VTLAVKRPADLVRSLQAEARARGLPLEELVADCLRQSLPR